MSQLVDDLKAARKLIEEPKGWTQGQFARDSEGFPMLPHSPIAVCFCSIGATLRATMGHTPRSAATPGQRQRHIGALDLLRGFLPAHSDIVTFNDTHTHEEVLAVFDKAIAAAEAHA